MHTNAYRRNLFDTHDHWINHPVNSFKHWLSEQKYKPSTAIVYQAMFGRFCQWLQEEGKTIDRCESGDIPRFLDHPNTNLPSIRQRAQSSRQRQQYVRLLEGVFAHLSGLGLSLNNPARLASIQGAGQGKDKPTRFLTLNERERIYQYLETRQSELEESRETQTDWVEFRDLALVAILLGAGLKVGNLEHLTLNCIKTTEKYIELSQSHYTHRARILPFAFRPIKLWLSKLHQLFSLNLEEAHPVFIADRSKGYGRQATTQLMHPSSVHRRIQKILALCGISGERASAQTLRNTYAAILIDTGASDHELVDFLGLQASITAQRLRASYSLFTSTNQDQTATAKILPEGFN